jgi:myosin protein heavy chain
MKVDWPKRQKQKRCVLACIGRIKHSYSFKGLERQLSTAQAKYQDFEDVVLEFQRTQESHHRQLETTRKQLDNESARRAQLEQTLSSQKSELAKLKDRNVKMDRELNKALDDLKAREWEVKQLESKQDKTIVEHVHVLEEAKRVTDRQLEEANKELQSNATYIRSLEKAKNRLASEAEDLMRETERERVELRSKEKNAKTNEDRAVRALADVEKERRAKETAELQSHRLQTELRTAHQQVSELSEQLTIVQRSKDNLETELDRIADETESSDSMAKMQRQYETRIAQLESQLNEAESTQVTAAQIRERVEHQHAELRHLVMASGPADEEFQARLLRELQLADDALEREMSSRSLKLRSSNANELHTMANVTPTKRNLDSKSGSRGGKDLPPGTPRASDKQVTALKQQVQVLEIQMAASDRVRRHLETSLREMTADLENSDGSKQFLQQYRSRLTKENTRLAELLEEEAEARRAAESAQIDGVQAMWTKFQSTITAERENYARLEESRKALVSAHYFFAIEHPINTQQLVQQRTAQGELETQRGQARELAQAKKQLQSEVTELREQLEVAKNDASSL